MALHVLDPEFQHLADPQAAPGHQFKQEAVAGIGGPEDHLVDGFLVQDLPRSPLSCPFPSFQGTAQSSPTTVK